MNEPAPYPAVALRVAGLACVRGGRTVFRGLDFTAGAGDAVALLGPNGAGKSSLLRLLAGLLPPAAGAAVWTGGDGTAHPPTLYCGHRDPVKAWLSVEEQLAFWRALEGGAPVGQASEEESGQAVRQAAASMGLEAMLDVAGALLSAGQRRRLALARLALTDAPVWLLDEPAVSLDAEGVALLQAAIGRHRARGGLAIVATHRPTGLPEARTVTLAGQDGGGPDVGSDRAEDGVSARAAVR